MSQQKNDIKFKFLPEKPLSDSNSTLFGHGEVVSTLKRIIKNSPENNSLTVGLFGDWGSGKSTIVESLKKELSEDKEPIPVVIFDVWKHEGDALRRSFLTQLVNDLKDKFIDENYKLNNRLTSSKKDSRITASSKIKFKWRDAIKRIISYFLRCILPPLVDIIFLYSFIMLLFHIEAPEFYEKINVFMVEMFSSLKPSALLVLSFFGSSAIVVFILERFLNLSTITSNDIVEVNYEKFEDPNEFEDEFREILKSLKSRKISIVFDNLDRVKGDKATSIISTIKTFLEPVDKVVEEKEIVFVIPCDDKAIKRHLVSELTEIENKEHYADEYLRKFFNTSIRIPSFSTTELEDYAWDCLEKTELKDLTDRSIAFLITQVFNDNPRQIVQFINTLITNYLVLWEREQNGSLGSKEFLSKNSPQLAKFLLLEQKFPYIMDNFRKNNIYELIDFQLNAKGNLKSDDPKVKDFNIFLKFTENIAIENLEIFFKLRISDHEKKLKNSSKLLTILETKSIKIIFDPNEKNNDSLKEDKKFICALKLKDNSEIISKIILAKLEDKKYNIYNFNTFLNNILYLKRFCSIQFTTNVYEKINSVYNQDISIPYFELIDPNILREEFINRHKKHFKGTIPKIINEWAVMIVNQVDGNNTSNLSKEFSKEILKNLIDYPDKIKKEFKPKISIFFKDNYLVNFDFQIANLATTCENAQSIFYGEDVISILISLFENDDINNTENSKISIYMNLDKKIITQKIYNEFILKMNQLLTLLTNSNTKPEEIFFSNAMHIMKKCIVKFNTSKVNFEDNNLSTALQQHYRFIETVSHIKGKDRRELLLYLATLEKLETPLKPNITTKLNALLNSTEVQELKIVFNELTTQDEFLKESRFDDNTLSQRLINDELFYQLVYEFSNEEMKVYHLTNVISKKKYEFFLNLVKKHEFDIPKKKEIHNKILQETKNAPRNKMNIGHQKSFYEIIEGLNLKDEEINTNEYLEQIKVLLNQNDQSKFKVGLSTLIGSRYFTKDSKKDYLLTYLNLFFSKIQSDNWKIKEVIINESNIIYQSDYDDLITNNISNLIQDLINTRTTDLYGEVSKVVSISTKKVLINNILKKLISEFNPPISQQFIRFKEIFNAILHETSSKDVYIAVKENLLLLLNSLLIPSVENEIQELIVKNISAIRTFSKNIPKEIQEKIDELFFHRVTPIDFKLSLEDYLSKEAKENRLKIISAKYVSNNNIIDITEKLNGLINASTLQVRVDNSLVSKDPVGKPKVLNLEYKFKGEVHKKSINENQNLRIP